LAATGALTGLAAAGRLVPRLVRDAVVLPVRGVAVRLALALVGDA
jgi:hypothetical protein